MFRSVAVALLMAFAIGADAKAQSQDETLARQCLALVYYDAIDAGNEDLAWLSATAYLADIYSARELCILAQEVASAEDTLAYGGMEYFVRDVLALAQLSFERAMTWAKFLAGEPNTTPEGEPVDGSHPDWESPFDPTIWWYDPVTAMYYYRTIPPEWFWQVEAGLLPSGYVYDPLTGMYVHP